MKKLILPLGLLSILVILLVGAKSCINRNISNTKSGSSTETFMINTPLNLTATVISYFQINLSWQDNSNNEGGFTIERKEWIGGVWREINSVGSNQTNYSDTDGLFPFNLYYYRVRAFNSIGDYSAYSNELSIITIQPVWGVASAGASHTLALTVENTVWSWGNNSFGQLGFGDTIIRNIPTLLASDFSWEIFGSIDKISTGYTHSLVRKTDGTIWSWGTNGVGQLGLGDTLSADAPQQIGVESDWSLIVAGNYHSFAIKTNNTLWVWGFNNIGQLGLGDSYVGTDRVTPTQLGTESNWVMADAGVAHTTALKSTGFIWAWGWNNYGQLGVGDMISRCTPVQIGSDIDWSVVTAGDTHTLVLKINGTLWGWGNNLSGQLGLGNSGYIVNTPTQIGIDSDWSFLAGSGKHTLAIKSNGTIWTWGNNDYGQLGTGDYIDRLSPIQIGTSSDWSNIAIGGWSPFEPDFLSHNIAVRTNGLLWVWGVNTSSQLGLGDTVNRNIPCPLGSPAPPSLLTAALISSSQINLSWTDNAYQENGFSIERKNGVDGIWEQITTLDYNVNSYFDTDFILGNIYYYRIKAYNNFGNSPYSNEAMVNPTPAAPSSLTFLSVSQTRIDLFWIDNSNNEDGFVIERKISRDGTYEEIGSVTADTGSYADEYSFSPNTTYYYRVKAYNIFGGSAYSNEVYTMILGDWLTVTGGAGHTIAVKTNGTIWAWGRNNYGQLGLGASLVGQNVVTPAQIGTNSDWGAATAYNNYTLARKSDQTIWSWGSNDYGKLGLGDSNSSSIRPTPTLITTTSDWILIEAGSNHAHGIKANNTIWSWGHNAYGQLGLGNQLSRYSPEQMTIGSYSDWYKTSSGLNHSLGLKTNNTIWVWGRNNYYQLGLGDTAIRNSPVQIIIGADSDWSAVVAGDSNSFAIKVNGIIWSWGLNGYGQLGLGDTVSRTTPAQLGIDSDWFMIVAGTYHTLAMKTNRTIWSWGSNSSGQLGEGTTVNYRTTPKQIGVNSDWSVLTAGDSYTLASKVNGTLWVWGSNVNGQLGLGDIINRNIPTLVGE